MANVFLAERVRMHEYTLQERRSHTVVITSCHKEKLNIPYSAPASAPFLY